VAGAAGTAGALEGSVLAVRATPEQQRLEVRVPGVGDLDAVAPLDLRTSPGDPVRLRVDVTRLAVLPGS
jgi:thiamine transport system ATP-binding protein